MQKVIALARYPLHEPGSAPWRGLVDRCKHTLYIEGLCNLPGFLLPQALDETISVLKPLFGTEAFTHARQHNIYFTDTIPGLDGGHPAYRRMQTVNHTLCADQIGQSCLIRLYEWPEFAGFLAAVMGLPALYMMDDPLARVNVMAYRAGEALNWHFDRAEFTTTLILQLPETGGVFEYAKDLRSSDQPNYQAVGDIVSGKRAGRELLLQAGTLNIFRGKNTAHRVTRIEGDRERIVAVFSFFDRPDVRFSANERLGFYGRAS